VERIVQFETSLVFLCAIIFVIVVATVVFAAVFFLVIWQGAARSGAQSTLLHGHHFMINVFVVRGIGQHA
jgi:hypothetical protein